MSWFDAFNELWSQAAHFFLEFVSPESQYQRANEFVSCSWFPKVRSIHVCPLTTLSVSPSSVSFFDPSTRTSKFRDCDIARLFLQETGWNVILSLDSNADFLSLTSTRNNRHSSFLVADTGLYTRRAFYGVTSNAVTRKDAGASRRVSEYGE